MKRNEEVNTGLISSNALLIVAPRGEVEAWARIIRGLALPRLCVYTDTLAKRRKIGAHSLSQYDVVITTFDVRTYLAEHSVVWCDAISQHVISYHIMSYHITSCHIISYHIVTYHIITYHNISYHIISYHIIS